MNSSQKKRKSEVHLENAGVQPSKKEKPWYHCEENDMTTPVPEKEKDGRRTSFLGGLLKKMRSSSTLKERNRSASTSKLVFKPKSEVEEMERLSQAPSEASDASYISDSSVDSLPIQFHKNADLLRFVEDVSREPSEDISYSNTSASSASQSHYHGSALSLCTPIRGGEFHRGHLRSSARSMPGDSIDAGSHLVNGLCNSVVRRNSSSASADRSPAAFLRRKSVRLIGKLSGSLMDLPEDHANQSFAPLAEVDDESDSPQHHPSVAAGGSNEAITPLAGEADQRRNERRLSWVKRSHSRVFGSSKKNRSMSLRTDDDFSSVSMFEPSILDVSSVSAVTPTGAANRTFCGASGSGVGTIPVAGGSGLRKTTPSSSSLQKRVSSVLRKGLGMRGSSSNMSSAITPTSGMTSSVTGSKLKRTKTSKHDRPVVTRRGTDVASAGSSKAITDAQQTHQLKEKQREANLFLSKTAVSDLPVLDTLASGQVDSVAVDLLLNGKPVSGTAASILSDFGIGDEIHKNVMCNPQYQKIHHIEGKPSVVFVKLDHNFDLARRVRNGIGGSLRQAFTDNKTRRLLLFPMFCNDESEWDSESDCIDQMLMVTMKSLGWNASPDNFDCAVFAGVTPENVELIKTRYQLFLDKEVHPVLREVEEMERKMREEAESTLSEKPAGPAEEDYDVMAASASETLV